MNLKQMVHGYMVCALWSSTDEDGNPLDNNYDIDDISDTCKAAMRETCADFMHSNSTDLVKYCALMKRENWSGEELAGHDFWLTRNGHGAGFWDRGLGALGERLTKAAKVYSSVDLYVVDGKIQGE